MNGMWGRHLLAGVRPLDAAIGLTLFVIGVADVLTTDEYAGGTVRLLLAMSLQTVPIVWQRARTLVAVGASLVGLSIEIAGQPPYGGLYGFVGFLLLVHAVSRWTRDHERRTGCVLLGVGAVIHTLAEAADGPLQALGPLIGTLMFSGAAWTVGLLGRRADEQVEQLVLEKSEAVSLERIRISRELHDIVGHALAGISLTSGAMQRATADPEVVEGLDLIGAISRDAATDVRQLVGYLRESSSDSAQPTLNEIPGLVKRIQDSGLEVGYEVRGTPGSASRGLQLAAFRVVQEGLTNCAKHGGGGRADVAIQWHPGLLEVSVSSDIGAGQDPERAGSIGDAGHGLIGLRERVSMYHGNLTAQNFPAGKFLLAATFPL